MNLLQETEKEMQKFIDKAVVLIEALPYIQRFKNKVVVVKYGGSTMAGNSTANVLQDVVLMECVGMHPVIVHGGGPAISQKLKEKKIEPKFVEGLRVTDDATMEVVEEVLMEINQEIVQQIAQFGGKARGLSGRRDEILYAKKTWVSHKNEQTGAVSKLDIGYVGEVIDVNDEPIKELLAKDIVPVIAPIGLGDDGHAYNLNADTAAGEIASMLRAEKLVYLTDVAGIMRDKNDPESLLSTLHIDDVERLIDEKVIVGGMIPKVRSGLKAVKAGVHKTHIIDGRLPHSVLLEIFTDKGVGTEIVQ